jgi:hypothetical protein
VEYWHTAVPERAARIRSASISPFAKAPAGQAELIAFSCKTRSPCPSCAVKRSVIFAENLAENVLLLAFHPHIHGFFLSGVIIPDGSFQPIDVDHFTPLKFLAEIQQHNLSAVSTGEGGFQIPGSRLQDSLDPIHREAGERPKKNSYSILKSGSGVLSGNWEFLTRTSIF